METYVAVQLTKDQAEMFIKFQKHFTFVNLLETMGVFDVKNGSVEIFFDPYGQIGGIDIHKSLRV